jgi:CubicO group peptidase (beta-lactamase class C family)
MRDVPAAEARAALPRTLRAIEVGIAAGDAIGVQLYASQGREVLADLGLGQARAGQPMKADHLNLWMSSVKPVTGVAIVQLFERGLLALDDPVARHLPEFAQGGKEAVTIRHCLTHTAGFPAAVVAWQPGRSFAEIVAEVCAAPLEPGWVPGRDAGYHVASAWYVLAEVAQRLDGRPYPQYVREEIFAPLGEPDAWIGMPEEVHRAYGDRIAAMHQGGPPGPRPHLYAVWRGGARACAMCRPGGNGWGPIRALGRLYEALLAGGAGPKGRLLTPSGVEALAARHTAGLVDRTFGVALDRGLGVVVDSKRHGEGADWFGPHASERTFGHAGFQSSVAFADPEHGLAVAIVWNGMIETERHAERARRTLAALYEDLGLARSAPDSTDHGATPDRVSRTPR